jgi:hypothetical protein
MDKRSVMSLPGEYAWDSLKSELAKLVLYEAVLESERLTKLLGGIL